MPENNDSVMSPELQKLAEAAVAQSHEPVSMEATVGPPEVKQPIEEKTSLDSPKGKAVIANLLQTLPPEAAKKLQEALNSPNPPHIHIDENQNVMIGEAADRAVEMRSGKVPAKITKLDEKRMRAFQERMRRWMNNHPDKVKGKSDPEAAQIAAMALQQEDYDNLPIDQKFQRLENVVVGSLKKLGEDLVTVQHNQYSISDAFDVNYRAIAKMFAKLGIPLEEHNKFMKEAQAEFEAERQADMQRQVDAQKKVMEAQKKAAEERAAKIEEQKMNAEAKEVSKPGVVAEGATLPQDATVFGG